MWTVWNVFPDKTTALHIFITTALRGHPDCLGFICIFQFCYFKLCWAMMNQPGQERRVRVSVLAHDAMMTSLIAVWREKKRTKKKIIRWFIIASDCHHWVKPQRFLPHCNLLLPVTKNYKLHASITVNLSIKIQVI